MKTLKQAIKETGRTFYGDWNIAEASPRKTEGALEFFTLGKWISDDDLQKEYESRGLVPADLWTLCEYSSKLPEDVATHWKDKDDNWCFAMFRRWDDERRVRVNRDGDNDWSDFWWFAGVRKSSENILSFIESEVARAREEERAQSESSNTLSLDSAIKICKEAGLTVTKIY